MSVVAAALLLNFAASQLPKTVNAEDYTVATEQTEPADEEAAMLCAEEPQSEEMMSVEAETVPYGVVELMTEAEKAAYTQEQDYLLAVQNAEEAQEIIPVGQPVYHLPITDELIVEASGDVEIMEAWRSPLVKETWIVSPFGMRLHPVYGYYKMHNGVDLDGTYWDSIVAARSGIVTAVGYHWASGYYVEIDHGNGFVTQYMHLSSYIVSEGQYVAGGELIGYVGATGTATGPHLHFGMIYNGSFVNPAKYIDF